MMGLMAISAEVACINGFVPQFFHSLCETRGLDVAKTQASPQMSVGKLKMVPQNNASEPEAFFDEEAGLPELLSQSDHGIRKRYMIRSSELAAAFDQAESGKLEIYPWPSPIGVVATRSSFDPRGRRLSEIYYRDNGLPAVPNDKSDIVPWLVDLHRYDDRGREVWTGQYFSSGVLIYSLESIYDEAGAWKIQQWRKPNGIIRCKQLFEGAGGEVGSVYFDETGKRILNFFGSVPRGMDTSGVPPALLPKPNPQPDFKDKKSFFQRLFDKNKKQSP